MSRVIIKGFGDGHSKSSAKKMAQEKLSEVKEYKFMLYNQKRAIRRKAKSFAIKDGVLCWSAILIAV